MFYGAGAEPGEHDFERDAAEPPCGQPRRAIGHIHTIVGSFTVARAGATLVHLAVGDPVFAGDEVETGADSTVGIHFSDGTVCELSACARMVLSEFACDGARSSSALFVLSKGAIAFMAGRAAKGGLAIDTPIARIRGSRGGGIVSLAVAALTFAALKEVRADDQPVIDDGRVELPHGTFELVTKEQVPQVIVVDDPWKTVVLQKVGSTVDVSRVTNSFERMDELGEASRDTFAIFRDGQRDLFIQRQQHASLGSSETISDFSRPGISTVSLVSPTNLINSDFNPASRVATIPVAVAAASVPEVAAVVPTTIVAQTPPNAPTFSITGVVPGPAISIGGDIFINANLVKTGFAINGTTAGVGDGGTVNVKILGSNSNVIESFTATVANNTWSLLITSTTTPPDGSYTLVASVSVSGGTAQASQPITVDTTTSESTISNTAVTTGTDNNSYINAAHFNGGSTTLTGTAEAGDTVAVSIDRGAAQTATVDASGNWTLTISGLLDGHTYLAVATATDPAGNTAQSAAFTFTVDTTTSESTISNTAVTTGTDNNSYINAAHFNGGSTTLTGTAEAGDTVAVSIDRGAAQTATVDASGNWTLTISGLLDGHTYLAVATATDPAGNTAQSAAFTFTVDTTTSESTISNTAVTTGTDNNSYINAAHFNGGSTTLTGTAEAGDTVAVSIDRGAAQTATVDASGNWTLTISGLLDGHTYLAVATATDPAGNTAQSAAFTFTVDTTTSESTISNTAVTTGTDNNSYINAAHFNGGSTTLTGTAEAGDTVAVSIDRGAAQTATVDASGNWTLTISGLLDGHTYLAVATATDPAGNTAQSAAFTFTVDTTTSESTISNTAVTTGTDNNSYINAAHFNGGSTTLTGTAEAGDTVAVSIDRGAAQTATVDASGNWTLTISGLLDGHTYLAVATATDPAGNTAQSAAFTFTVDTTAPAISFDTVFTDTGQVRLSGEVSDNVTVSQVQVFNGTTLLGTATVDSQNHTWSLTTPLQPGIPYNQLSATAIDEAGNTNTASIEETLQVLTTGQEIVNYADTTTDHIVIGTYATLNYGNTPSSGDRLIGGTGADTLEIIGSVGHDGHTGPLDFGDWDDIDLSNFEYIKLIDTSSGPHNDTLIFEQDFKNNGTLTIDGSGIVNGNLVVDASANSGSFVIIGSSKNDILSGGSGNDTLTGNGGADQFRLRSDSGLVTITDYTDNTDKIGFLDTRVGSVNFAHTISSAAGTTLSPSDFVGTLASISAIGSESRDIIRLTGSLSSSDILTQISSGTANNDYVNDYVIVFNSTTGHGEIWFDTNWQNTAGRIQVAMLNNITTINDLQSITASDIIVYNNTAAPAGVAGEAINLALADPVDHIGAVTVTIAGVPSGWTMSEGTDNGNDTWTVQTDNIGALSITSPAGYAGGALALRVMESWTNADGTTAFTTLTDNVEAFAPGNPIFAISGDDYLTGSSGQDLFVFSQPIGQDVIYSFDASHDQIDLIGYAGIASFDDVKSHLTADANGDAVIALADGQSITLDGIAADSLSASNFVFDQTPVTNNAGVMTIGDGALLPLSGAIDNTGTIALDLAGHVTTLELIQHGITLQGGGHLTLSDSNENLISSAAPGVTFTNADNTISGAGQLGDWQMTLVNNGTIAATGAHALIIDTGSNVVINTGTLDSTGSGGLIVNSDVSNAGLLWAHGGDITVNGSVSGAGGALITGDATLEFAAAASINVTFVGADDFGTLVLDNPAAYTGQIFGFTGTSLENSDIIDLKGITFDVGTSWTYHDNIGFNTGGILTVDDTANGVTMAVDGITFGDGEYTTANFILTSDGNGGTLIADPPEDHVTTAIDGGQTADVGGHTGSTHITDAEQALPSTLDGNAGKIAAFALDFVSDQFDFEHMDTNNGVANSQPSHWLTHADLPAPSDGSPAKLGNDNLGGLPENLGIHMAGDSDCLGNHASGSFVFNSAFSQNGTGGLETAQIIAQSDQTVVQTVSDVLADAAHASPETIGPAAESVTIAGSEHHKLLTDFLLHG